MRPAPNPNSTSESGPSREAVPAKPVVPVPNVPQDEVRVQQDTSADYIMIYQYVNQQSGNLILQVPDQQILSLIHQIQAMLQSTQQQASAASAPPAKL